MTSKPYEYVPEHLSELKSHVEDDKKPWGADWSAPGLVPLRTALKRHHMDQEIQRCVYCREEIRDEHAMHWNIDHVIPKSIAPEYTYFPQNLALSCWGCNQAKGVSDPRTVSATKFSVYPSESRHYKVFHPYFDEWEDHFVKDADSLVIFAVEKSKKANETIARCNLPRIAQRQAKLKMSYKQIEGIQRVRELLNKDNSEIVDAIADLSDRFPGPTADFSLLLRDLNRPAPDDD